MAGIWMFLVSADLNVPTIDLICEKVELLDGDRN